MTLPPSDILIADTSSDRGVLLSERTQLLAIKALQIAEFRTSWDEMSDSDWDDLEAAIGEAHAELLTELDMQVSEFHVAERTTTQAITANTITKVQFDIGSYAPFFHHVDAPVGGICTVAARVSITSATAGLKWARILHNGVEIVRGDARSTALGQYFTMTHVLEVAEGDTFNLEVFGQTASTVAIADFTPMLSMVIV